MKNWKLWNLPAIFAMLALMISCSPFEDTVGDLAPVGGDGETNEDSEQDTEFPFETSEVIPDASQPEALVLPDNPEEADVKLPKYVHMTWQHAPDTTVTFQWQTEFSDTGTYTPKVWLVKADEMGEDGKTMPFALQFTREGEGFNYSTYFANGTEPTLVQWTVEVTHLEPQTLYYYRVGTWEDFDFETKTFTGAALGEMKSFSTGLSKGQAEPFRVFLAGDSRGGYDGIRDNIQRLRDMNADFWLFNGDMTDAGSQEQWYIWFDSMKPIVESTVMMPVQGNHEIIAELYYHQFALPRVAELGDYQEHGYSFDYGNVHFVGVNTCTDDVVQAQVQWLDKNLEAARNDSDTDWIIVLQHHPAFSASNHGSERRVQTHFVPLYHKYEVDLVFAGHDHNYERSYPINKDGIPIEDGFGVMYVVAGGFYSDGYNNGSDTWTAISKHGDKGNYVVLDIAGKTIDAVAYFGDGEEIERFQLTHE